MTMLDNIWRFIGALRNAIGNLLLIAVLIIILVAMLSRQEAQIADQTALILNISGDVVEQTIPVDPLQHLLGGSQSPRSETTLRDIQRSLELARDDKRIKALILDLDQMGAVSLSKLQEIGTSLADFKSTGKPVYAYGLGYNQAQYYLAAHADHLYLNSLEFGAFSSVLFQGFGVYPTFYREALEKLKVKIHVFRVGDYKSAVEPFIRDDMSPESRESTLRWLTVLWDAYRQDVVRLRTLTVQQFNDYIENFDVHLEQARGDFGQLALDRGFVDKLTNRPDFEQEMIELVGQDNESFNQLDFATYLQLANRSATSESKQRIAVITARGTILDGDYPPGTIGSESLIKLITSARENEQVSALVLRIDSPGGSATASEQIRFELARTQQKGKPIVVSMSGVAASGGYWIASTADRILASPTTVTGSIGIFSMWPELSESVAALGLRSDGVGTTPLAAAANPLMPINTIWQHSIQQSVERGYRQFISLVSRGRDMSPEEVDKVAQGQVWAGATALDIGLVDQLGNLQDAIAAAAELAGVEDFSPLYLEKELSPREQLIENLMNSASVRLRQALQGSAMDLVVPVAAEMNSLLRLNDPQGMYLHCLPCIGF